MSDRGMKKWAPYKSLPEQDPHLLSMKKNKTKIEKPKISNEEAERINDILVNYHGQKLAITYYKNGELYTIESTILKIDIYNRKIITEEKIVLLSQLTNIEEL